MPAERSVNLWRVGEGFLPPKATGKVFFLGGRNSWLFQRFLGRWNLVIVAMAVLIWHTPTRLARQSFIFARLYYWQPATNPYYLWAMAIEYTTLKKGWLKDDYVSRFCSVWYAWLSWVPSLNGWIQALEAYRKSHLHKGSCSWVHFAQASGVSSLRFLGKSVGFCWQGVRIAKLLP